MSAPAPRPLRHPDLFNAGLVLLIWGATALGWALYRLWQWEQLWIPQVAPFAIAGVTLIVWGLALSNRLECPHCGHRVPRPDVTTCAGCGGAVAPPAPPARRTG